MCIRDRYAPFQNDRSQAGKCGRTHVPVSYTHLDVYKRQGVHSNCAVTEVEVKNAEAKILSENVTYYKETVRPWAGN